MANSTVFVQLAQAVKGSLAEVGIDMTIETLDSGSASARRQSGDFGAAFSLWPPDVDPDGNLYSLLRTGGSSNNSRYSNAKVDELLDKARITSDQQERQAAYHQIQAIVLEDAPVLMLHRDADIKLLSKRLQGAAPTFDTYFSVHQLWLQK